MQIVGVFRERGRQAQKPMKRRLGGMSCITLAKPGTTL